MRAILMSVLAWSMFSAAANAQDANQAAAQTQPHESLSIGDDQCFDVRDGLPPENGYGRAPVILWGCHGRNNQNVQIVDGKLLFGAERAIHTRPIIVPGRECYDDTLVTPTARHVFHVCPGNRPFRVDRSQPGLVTYYVYGRTGQPLVGRGAPLIAERTTARRPAFTRFAMSEARDRVTVTGTDLCVTRVSGDTSPGAPLYLDTCGDPEKADPAEDGPERQRVSVITH